MAKTEKIKSPAKAPHELNILTSQPPLLLPEYGRNIQKMVEFCCNIEDRQHRNQVAHSIIAVMGQLNPHYRDINEYKHKLWDHLYVMSGFSLDVDSPYPKPTPDEIAFKPEKVKYPGTPIKIKHYGKLMEIMIAKAAEFNDGPLKDLLVETLANHMKKSYITWNNKNFVDDATILGDLAKLSNGKVRLNESANLKSTHDIVAKTRKKPIGKDSSYSPSRFRRNPRP